ncbi:hypothetical protein OWP19_23525 [Bacillus cereus]|uniref:hypothetical protein n=1 Tax=Bacillus cereus group TaxID=86661 RepID=UPI00254A2CD8|nr:hypothetical protein [Bacillus cereus]MDK7480940.1 hypothetical protein [Bacillus cereus]HDR8003405.1 hypothetical protein [Bacillus cereus]HDR8014951.1 hypothetical protein [Bacillus cereus]
MYKLIIIYNSPKLGRDVIEEFTFETKEKFNAAYKDIVIKNHELGVEHVKYDFELTVNLTL